MEANQDSKSPLERAVEAGLIDRDYHAALLRSAERVAQDANIHSHLLFTSMVGHATQDEVDYVLNLHGHLHEGTYGLVVRAEHPKYPVMDRFAMMAAAFLRNYVSARVMTIQDVIAALRDEAMPTPTVLMVPNFLVGLRHTDTIPEWQVPLLAGLLYNRQAAGLQTVVYVQHWKSLERIYGSTIYQTINNHYLKVDE